jgi:hypothetical protein
MFALKNNENGISHEGYPLKPFRSQTNIKLSHLFAASPHCPQVKCLAICKFPRITWVDKINSHFFRRCLNIYAPETRTDNFWVCKCGKTPLGTVALCSSFDYSDSCLKIHSIPSRTIKGHFHYRVLRLVYYYRNLHDKSLYKFRPNHWNYNHVHNLHHFRLLSYILDLQTRDHSHQPG